LCLLLLTAEQHLGRSDYTFVKLHMMQIKSACDLL
jgi:hypothetical protein